MVKSFAMKKQLDLDSNEKNLTRNFIQKIAMSSLYDILTYVNLGLEVDIKGILSNLTNQDYEEVDPYLKEIDIEAIKHLDEAVKALENNMHRWKFFRRNRVEQAILLLSYIHYYYVDSKVDKNVVIDVAIKLSKEFTAPNDFKFVNAVLDKSLCR